MQNRNKIRAIAISKTDKNSKFIPVFFSFLILLLALLFTHQVQADNREPAEQEKASVFIKQLSARVIDVLKDTEMPVQEREDHFRDILDEGFAVQKIGKLVLGRHRKKATQQEIKDYYELFPEFLIKLYATRLGKLETQSITIGKVIPHAKKDIYVRSKILNANDKIFDVDWRVRPDKAGDYKIIDIKIEGISMARTQRDDFTSRVGTSGVGGLNQYMRDIVTGEVSSSEEENITAASPEKDENKS